ncbi:hypothetical protein C5167_008162 [Papaver somniferum]|uniref:Peptidase metallopeptidase domain-containing protein n=1 Tax=Papaver somniferum TaxID=3469 RepID=A0A4Y7JWN3_PAPSO|nr:metalloendoproteinase 2-MMP-like [Papaver somniferum]RZC64472.1 hypothetical protein C5167_008162 [Papaver somniferum]
MTNPKAAALSPFQIVSLLSIFILAIFPNPILSTKSSKGFEFLKNLEGCHKGQTVKGLHELKLYLKKFGYAADVDNHTEYEHSDKFDDILEEEIKTYQLNYHLKATGNLDAETVKQMTAPRCGFPDIVNRKTPMGSGNKKESSLHTVSHFTFIPGNPRWRRSKSHLTYRFSSTVPVIDVNTLRAVCSSAFARWAEVTHFTFSEAVHQADIVIGFHRGDHGDGIRNSFDGRGNTIAHAFPPEDGRFHYDADDKWSTHPGSDAFDLESVALHEIGHLLGLGHSTERNAVMFSSIQPGSIKRQLYANDIRGVRTLYGLRP